MALANLSIYYTWKKSAYNNNKFKTSAPTWNNEFDLPDTLFQTFKIILTILLKSKKLYKNRIVFKVNTGYELELLSSETMKLWGSTKKDVDQDKDGEVVPKLESVEVILVNRNLVNSSSQQASKVLFIFVPNKKFGQLITVAPQSLTMLNTKNREFSSIEVCFTD